MNSHSTGRPAQEVRLCESCNEPLLSHVLSCPSPPASSLVKAGDRLTESNRELAHEILFRLPPDGGSSLTARGGRASRSWSVTGSSGSVCRRLRHAKSASTSRSGPSTAGTGTGRTSDSSRWWREEVDIIGMAARIPADQHHVPIHDAFCPICKRWEK